MVNILGNFMIRLVEINETDEWCLMKSGLFYSGKGSTRLHMIFCEDCNVNGSHNHPAVEVGVEGDFLSARSQLVWRFSDGTGYCARLWI